MAAGWVDTDRGAFSRYKSVWLLSTTQQLITLGLGAGKQRSPIQSDKHTHTHRHKDAHTDTVKVKHSAQTQTDILEQFLTPKTLACLFLRWH